jgi:localization factor PodJL
MNSKRSYLDSINAGRKRRPNPSSFEDMDRTLARLEGRVEREREAYREPRNDDYRAPRRGTQRPRHRRPEEDYQPEIYDDYASASPQPHRGGGRPSFDVIARDMERARQQEDGLGAVGKIAAELKAMREELRQQMGQGLRREFDQLRADIEGLRAAAPSTPPAELGAEFERLSDAVRGLAERSDDRSVNMLRLELEKVKSALDELAREETVRSVDRRWDDFDRRWSNLETRIEDTPSRRQVEPTLKALNAQLERIKEAVDGLPESLSLRPLEDKLRHLSESVDQFSDKHAAKMPEAFSMIEQRLDEITRAIAASGAAAQAQPFDTEPFERIEARVSSLARQIDELAEDQTSEQMIDRLNALSHRVEEIAQRIEMPESAVEVLADQISAIAGKLEQDPSRNYADVIFQGMEDRFAQISQMLERRQDNAIEQGQQLFRELERQLEAVSSKLEERENETAASNAGMIDAMERRFAELAAHFDAGQQQGPHPEMMSSLEQRLEDISRRLDNSAQHVAGIDPALIKSLESQVAALSAHLDKPGQPLPEFEDITPRLDHIEQSLAQGREAMMDAARQAAQEAVTSLPSGGASGNVSAISSELKAIEELSRKSDERNAKTFETIHDTLLKIVDRLGALEQKAQAAPTAKPAFTPEHTPSIEGAYEQDDGDDLDAYRSEAAPQVRSPAAAAAAAASHALGRSAPEPAEEGSGKRSMLGGLTRALTGRKEANSDTAEKAERSEPKLDEPLDPSVANQPLEPGSGAPDLNAIMKRVRDENGQPGKASSMDAAKSDFIAAARRAAQAAAAEAEAMKHKSATGTGGSKLGVSGLFKGRTRTALMAATAIVVVVGAWQLGGAFLSGNGKQQAPVETSEAPSASLPLSAEMIPDEDGTADAPPARMAGEMKATETAQPTDGGDEEGSADTMLAEQDSAADDTDDRAMADGADGVDVLDERMALSDPTPMPMEMHTEQSASGDVSYPPAPAEAGPVALREAADSGDPKAMYEIGNRYAEGRGVDTDMEQAAAWYERAAEIDYALAQYRLGNLYEKGNGVERDIGQAMNWYERAAKQGNASAMHNLAVLHAMGGTDGEADNDRAARWFLEAAELGVKDSQYNLGILSAKGAGVPQSLEESYKWFALVAKTGDRDAAAKRDEVAKALRPEQLEKAKQATELWKARPVVPEVNVADIPEEWTEGDAQTASVDQDEIEKAVRNIQAILNNNGYEAGPADGVLGEKTKAAIKAFQADNGMQADGEVDDELVKALLERK